MAILVTGGAGYIGSVMVELLRTRGEGVVVLDNLDRGHRTAVDGGRSLFTREFGNRALVRQICEKDRSTPVFTLQRWPMSASRCSSPNVTSRTTSKMELLCSIHAQCGVRQFVFSSTCATYARTSSNTNR
jgi:UDP-glucose 4-epimerase